MDVFLLLLVLLLAIDFVISIWNGYASGRAIALLEGTTGQKLTRAAAYAGLGLGFAGMAYIMSIVFGFVAVYLSYLSWGQLDYLLAFNFLVFGALIIGFGMVVTAQSIAIAYRRRSFGAIALSAWNIFAEVWDIAIYAEGFRAAYSTLQGGGRGKGNVWVVVLIAVLVALFITYAAYRHGYQSARKAIAPTSSYNPVRRPLAF